ncbi:GDSL-type esterase/lipase family protein [Sporosarcina cyprini]|uniref:GDSL-type esterase/lipase family protein n=1 Tax=Sporosarcina cyprini TaxID=2910523 RepID=UPI001EE0713C|nr:GDSL-type esterase/lipase family protein [Sporosarcina cyprini]MCG3088818.1 GDSL-type esterase/lipase family protein [Sporosarcina cyprini]
MRRYIVFMVIFSFLLAGCQADENLEGGAPFSGRMDPAFTDWYVPDYFIPETVYVVGLGDSLTEGVGDERKKDGYFGRMTRDMERWKGVKEIESNNLAKRGKRSDQLIEQMEDPEVQSEIKRADVIYLTIGGNDIMKVVKANIFKLKMKPFYAELGEFENRLDEVFKIIRGLNGDAIIVIAGLYNPFSIVTDEPNEFETIIEDWNEAIEVQAIMDEKACFVPVIDLFDSNEDLVYHTDFFHPNAKGYDTMAARYKASIQKCGLAELSEGKLDFGE